MNNAVKDIVFIILIIIVCFGFDKIYHANEHIEILECKVNVLTRRVELAEGICDSRFDFGCKYWDDSEED